MKKLMAWATAFATVPFLLIASAEAAPRSHYRETPRFHASDRADIYAGRKSHFETMDTIRANDLDPAGDYKGYPDWARAAFAPKK